LAVFPVSALALSRTVSAIVLATFLALLVGVCLGFVGALVDPAAAAAFFTATPGFLAVFFSGAFGAAELRAAWRSTRCLLEDLSTVDPRLVLASRIASFRLADALIGCLIFVSPTPRVARCDAARRRSDVHIT
jgi:hypothetical protein